MEQTITRKEQLFSNTVVNPLELRRYLKMIIDNRTYLMLTRVANLSSTFFNAVVNSLFFQYISIEDLEKIEVFNYSSVNKLIERVIREQRLDSDIPSSKGARGFIFNPPNEDEGAKNLGMGSDLIWNNNMERRQRRAVNCQFLCRFYDIYTHVASYYSYPSESRFVSDFRSKVREQLLLEINETEIRNIFPLSGLTVFMEEEDILIREAFAYLYDNTFGKICGYLTNDNIHELVFSSRHKINGLMVNNSVSQALLNFEWPLSCREDSLNTIVSLMEENNQNIIEKDDEVYNKSIDLSIELPFLYGISSDMSLFLCRSEMRKRLGSESDARCMETYLNLISRLKTLVERVADLSDENLKVKAIMNYNT